MATNEDVIYETLVTIVKDETALLLQKTKRDWTDFQKLEKLAKIYATLKDDVRADVKDSLKG